MSKVDLSGDVLGKDNEYELVTYLGGGAFGQVYVGNDFRHSCIVAIKTESKNADPPQLAFEYERLKSLQGQYGFPRLFFIGRLKKNPDFHAIAMEYLDKSLADLVKKRKTFSEPTLLQIACQCICRLKQFHETGYIYRDIKPANFCMGPKWSKHEETSKILYLIDFGLSKVLYVKDERGQKVHIPKVQEKSILGTAIYMSIDGCKGLTQGRRDDLEALAYMLSHLGTGSLPWDRIRQDPKDPNGLVNYYEQIRQAKEKTSAKDLFKGFDPVFYIFLQTVKSLKHTDKPNYDGYMAAFAQVLYRKYFKYIDVYDWEDGGSL